MKWHEVKITNNEVFDFASEIVAYCRSDVDILRKACLCFRNMLLDIAGSSEVTLNDQGGEMVSEIQGAVDPFNELTIASVCSKVFRSKFLKENWNVKLKTLDGDITDWLPAVLQDGTLSIRLSGKYHIL